MAFNPLDYTANTPEDNLPDSKLLQATYRFDIGDGLEAEVAVLATKDYMVVEVNTENLPPKVQLTIINQALSETLKESKLTLKPKDLKNLEIKYAPKEVNHRDFSYTFQIESSKFTKFDSVFYLRVIEKGRYKLVCDIQTRQIDDPNSLMANMGVCIVGMVITATLANSLEG